MKQTVPIALRCKFLTLMAALLFGISSYAGGSSDYSMIGGAADLVNGGMYLLSYGEDGNGEYAFFKNHDSSNNYGGFVTANVADFFIEKESINGAMPLTLVKNGDNWAIQMSDDKYLSYQSGSNKNALYTSDVVNDASLWTITFNEDSHCAEIVNVGTTVRKLQWNSNKGTERFSCYTGSQKNPFLFKLGPVTTKPSAFVAPEFQSVADFNEYQKETSVKITMNNWKISELSGKKLYLTDGVSDGTILIYDSAIPQGWIADGILNGTFEGSSSLFKEEWEITDVKSWEGVTYSAPSAPTLIKNGTFDIADDFVSPGICTYRKDMESNGTTYSQMVPVKDWTITSENGDARASGVLQYGTNTWLGGNIYVVPATNKEGEATGGALGILAVWTGSLKYSQDVELKAGTYILSMDIYNQAGTAPFVDNYMGYYVGGVTTKSVASVYPVGEWTTERFLINLEKDATVTVNLGYAAPNQGGGSCQHLFVDNVKITEGCSKEYVQELYDKAKAFVEAQDNMGEGLFQYPASAFETLSSSLDEVKKTLDKEDASSNELLEAVASLLQSSVAFENDLNIPAATDEYELKLIGTEGNLGFSDGKILLSDGAKVRFEKNLNDGWNIINAENSEEYVFYSGTNAWTLSTTYNASKEGWTVSCEDGKYTFEGANGLLGTNSSETALGSEFYGDKNKNGNVYFTIEKALPTPEWMKNPKYEPLADDGNTIQYIYNIKAGAFMIGANEWETRASIDGECGNKFKIKNNGDGTWTLNDSVLAKNKSKWSAVFAESFESIWVDNAAGVNANEWVIENTTGNIYKISNPKAAENGFLSVDPFINDTRLYLSSNADDLSDWAFVSSEEYFAWINSVDAEKVQRGKLLGRVILNAQKECDGIDIADEIAIYKNYESTGEQLEEAANNVVEKVFVWKQEHAEYRPGDDVTDLFIVNGNYMNGTEGWTFDFEPTFSKNEEFGIFEAYSGWDGLVLSSFNVSQKVTLPKGYYRLESMAFYRQGEKYNVDPEKSLAKLYVNGDTSIVATLGSIDAETYADGLPEALAAFAAGNYSTSTEFVLKEETEIEIGYTGTFDLKRSWFVAGPWKLTYIDEKAPAVVENGDYYIMNSETGTWLGGGNAYATQGSLVKHGQIFTLKELADGKISFDSHTYYSNIRHFLGDNLYVDSPEYGWEVEKAGDNLYTIKHGNGKYLAAVNGSTVLDTIADVTAASKWSILSKEDIFETFSSASAEKPVDATFLIKNANFSRSHFDVRFESSWELAGDCSNINLSGGKEDNCCAESWRSKFNVHQDLVDLPNGNYVLSAQASVCDYDQTFESLAVVYANDVTSPFCVSSQKERMEDGENGMAEMSASFSAGKYFVTPLLVNVTDGTLTLGVKNSRTTTWCVWDNFELYYYGEANPYVAEAQNALNNGEAVLAKTVGPVVMGSDVKLITNAAQLSSNYPEPTQGSLAALIDEQPGTYFHSTWSETTEGIHNLQVSLPENAYTMFCLKYTNRSGSGSSINYIKTVKIYGSNDNGETYSDVLAEVTFPDLGAGGTGEIGLNLGDTPYTYYRFDVTDCYPEYKQYFHCAEFQLYEGKLGTPEFDVDPALVAALNEAIEGIKTKISDGTVCPADIEALNKAAQAVKDAASCEYTINITGAPSEASVYVGNGVYTDGQSFTSPAIEESDVVVSQFDGYKTEVKITAAHEIKVVYSVSSIEAINNECAFTMTCPRGLFHYTEGSASPINTFSESIAIGADEWAFICSKSGNYYLYNIGSQKFLSLGSTDGYSVTEEVQDAIVINTSNNAEYPFYFTMGDKLYININGSNKLVVDPWNTLDNGNQFKLVYAGTFDLTGVLEMVDAYEDSKTGINSVVAGKTVKGAIYNLAGQRIATPQKGQTYIMNGQKFLAK